MRKIEQLMLDSIEQMKSASLGNTTIRFNPVGTSYETTIQSNSEVFLYGNHIATYWHGTRQTCTNLSTLKQWPTPTTKSRLRALGVNVTTRKRVTYLNNEAI